LEKQSDYIALNTHFRLVLQIINKTTSNNFYYLEHLKLKITHEKTSEREAEIIDIIEKVNSLVI
jgi:hypothetical protein